jgi:hypothetical protein
VNPEIVLGSRFCLRCFAIQAQLKSFDNRPTRPL